MFFCCAGFFANAQTVSYTYDASGNRTHRTIIMPLLTPPPQDSTENAIEDPEFPVASVQNEITENSEETHQEIYTDILAGTQIAIYPNPTRGQLVVTSNGLQVTGVEIFDVMGKLQKAEGAKAEGKFVMDISALPAGTYMMRIMIDNEAVSWKIIKQ
jgi:hypothetical protein